MSSRRTSSIDKEAVEAALPMDTPSTSSVEAETPGSKHQRGEDKEKEGDARQSKVDGIATPPSQGKCRDWLLLISLL